MEKNKKVLKTISLLIFAICCCLCLFLLIINILQGSNTIGTFGRMGADLRMALIFISIIISVIIVAIIWILYGIVKLIKYIIQRIKNKTMTIVGYFYIFITLLFLSIGIFFLIKFFSY